MDSAADFEDEMLALNPEYDLIFTKYNEACSRESPPPFEFRRRYSPNKMKIITKMNDIIGQKPIGELPTHSDWDEQDSIEKETIALMRKFGLQQSVDRPPDEKRTIATIPTTDDVIIMRNGHKKMSIFMSDSFFELKARTEPTFCMDDEPGSHEESNASTSEISNDTSLSSEISSTSPASSSRIQPQSNIEYKHVPSDNTTDSSKAHLDLSWRRRSPTSAKSPSSNSKDGKSQLKYTSKVWCNKSRRLLSNDNTNWRSGCSKSTETVETKETDQRVTAVDKVKKDEPKIERIHEKNAEKVEKCVEVEQKSVPKIVPKGMNNCGARLYKPKDLFLKKKAMRIQQVLSENQSL